MTTPRVDPFADLAGLANRIAQKLKANPKDTQLRDDLRYVQSLMPKMARNVSATDNPPEPSAGQQVRAGLSAIPGDLIRGAGTMAMHPIQTLGQMSGAANREQWAATAHDPSASLPEKLDAFARATPLNAGYAPFRAFLEATGMKSDEPAPLSEQVRQGGDIAASLALSRVSPSKAGAAGLRLAGRLLLPRWVRGVLPRVTAAMGKGAEPEMVSNVAEAAIRSRLTKQGFSTENVEQLVATWKNGGRPAPIAEKPPTPPAPPVLRPGETVEQIAPNGFAIHGTRATPPAPTQPPFWEQVRGPDVRDLGKGQTLPYYPRGGQVEQGMAPTPQSSPAGSLVGNQNAAFADFMRGATPQDLPNRLATLRALGVQLPQNAEAELLRYLGTPR